MRRWALSVPDPGTACPHRGSCGARLCRPLISCEQRPELGHPQEDVRERGLAVQPGHAAREALFMLDPNVAYLNHGSFGASFRCFMLHTP